MLLNLTLFGEVKVLLGEVNLKIIPIFKDKTAKINIMAS